MRHWFTNFRLDPADDPEGDILTGAPGRGRNHDASVLYGEIVAGPFDGDHVEVPVPPEHRSRFVEYRVLESESPPDPF